jgi:hypothetical protein
LVLGGQHVEPREQQPLFPELGGQQKLPGPQQGPLQHSPWGKAALAGQQE